MARTDRNQRPASPGIDLTGKKPTSAGATLALTTSALAALWAIALLTGPGRVAYAYAFYFLEFFGGVFTLVGLTLTVMIGLLATDRLILQPRQRVWIQSAHRTLGIISVACLAIHILTKVSEGRATVTGTVVPFLGGASAGQSALYLGLGPVAGYLMVSVLWTGLIRRRFAGTGRPWMWRALHSVAYLSWPVSLLHGLGAGRPPAAWVTLSYLACVLAVAIALLFRLSVGTGRRKQSGRLATTTLSTNAVSMRPVGKLAPAARRSASPAPAVRASAARASRDTDTQFIAEKLDPVQHTAPAPVDEPVRHTPAPAPREERYAPAAERYTPAPREERYAPAAVERYAPTRTRSARHSADEYVADLPAAAVSAPPSRRRTRSADEYLVTPDRTARDQAYGTTGVYGPPPARRADQPDSHLDDRLVDDRRAEPRRARRAADDEPRYRATAPAPPYIPAPSPVDDLVPELDILPPDDTPTLVDLASRRAIRDATRQRDAARDATVKARRDRRRKKSDKDDPDEDYWGYLRGEAQ